MKLLMEKQARFFAEKACTVNRLPRGESVPTPASTSVIQQNYYLVSHTTFESGAMTKQEEKFNIVEAWKQSGVGTQKYTEQNGIGYGTMQYWYNRYRSEQQKPSEPARFVVLDVPPGERAVAPAASGIVIVLPRCVRIEVR